MISKANRFITVVTTVGISLWSYIIVHADSWLNLYAGEGPSYSGRL